MENTDFTISPAQDDYLKLAIRYLEVAGCFVVRNAIDVGFLKKLKKKADFVYEKYDNQVSRKTMDNHFYDVLYRYGHIRFQHLAEHNEKPDNLFAYVVEKVVNSPSVFPVVRSFGEPIAVLPGNSLLRRQIPAIQEPIPFHQDAYFLGLGVGTVVNFWIPLIDCGIDAPGLELVPKRLEHVFKISGPEPEENPYDSVAIPEAVIQSHLGTTDTLCPVLKLGDAIAFLSTTLHRTFVTPGMTRPRISIEMRFCSRALLPAGYPHMVIRS